METKKPKAYRTYLLRCWRQIERGPQDLSELRFSLQEILQKKREFGFGDFDEMVNFLVEDLLRENSWEEDQTEVSERVSSNKLNNDKSR